jgi:hypothetical protein
MAKMKVTHFAICFAALALLFANGATAFACPFCSVETQTLSEESASADAVVLAKLVEEAAPAADTADPNTGTAKFEVIEVLRGQDAVAGAKQIDVVYFGETDKERVFLIMGLGAEKPDWTTPLPLSTEAVDYVRKLSGLPASGAERLAFFQEFLEHDDPLLAQDAYDEFARAPYEDVQALAPRMHHDRLVKWISDLEISPSRRRLYLTMLGVCGGKDDLPLLESMIVSDFDAMEGPLMQIVHYGMAMGGPIGLPAWVDIVEQRERQKKLGLDALVACYLTLRGPDGLDLIDERFLKNSAAEYTYIYSTIMALRFHGDLETGVLPRERLLKSMRLLLDNADFADQVILDLSRWEDWSVLDRLVEMFKTSDDTSYVRQPVVTYLTVASEQPSDVGPRAKAALEELEQLAPETVKQARSLMMFGSLGRARGGAESGGDGAEDGSAAADPAQGFGATAADDQTDPADIPDPTAYEESDPDKGLEVSADAKDPAPVAGSVKTARAGSDKVQVAAASPAATPPMPEVASPPEPLFVVGLPLVAAALLMGVYWLILRAGAV